MGQPLLLGVVAVVWHGVFVYSMVDLYFRSPVVSVGREGCPQPAPAPALRTVLLVADGLRADRLLEEGLRRAPFLGDRVRRDGCWGVSHTRVPTESRPGHVALLAGIYEDVAAVTRGWKHNPVRFDSVFNHTRHSFALGSPDIVPMFSDGLPSDRMTVLTYDAAFEDFMAADAAQQLDQWVFDRWLANILHNASLAPLLDAPQTLHFLHLLGLDTNGHAFRPGSLQYLHNIESVDRGIKRVFDEMEKRFPDGRTAYLFTSDHGMSDKGSHGAGHPSETETPLIAWGAGIRGPKALVGGHVQSPREWLLDDLERSDVEQADVAPLISALLGLPIPANSVGRLPLDWFADPNPQMMVCNAGQLLALLQEKHQLASRSSLPGIFRPWTQYEHCLSLYQKVEQSDPARRVLLSREIMDLSLVGIRYYDRYDRPFLYLVLSVALFCWLLFLGSLGGAGSASHTAILNNVRLLVDPWHGLIVLGGWAVLFWCGNPWSYYAYVFFAVLWASAAWRQQTKIWQLIKSVSVARVVVAVAVVEIFVVGFFWRSSYAVLLLALAATTAFVWQEPRWGGLLLVSAVFPLIPPDTGSVPALVVLGGLLMASLVIYCRAKWWWVALIVGALFNGVFFRSHLVSWSLCVLSVVMFFFAPGPSMKQDALAFGGSILGLIGPMYILLSISYEAIFLSILGASLLGWIGAERHLRRSVLPFHNVRSSLLYLLFTYLSFFGTGNTGSMSSFEISSTYTFVTVFSPFLMGALLLVKIVLPFLLVGCAFSFIQLENQIPEQEIFVTVLALSDVMAYTFFFLVRDEGSWREIGISISHFVMSNMQIVAFLILTRVPMLLGVRE